MPPARARCRGDRFLTILTPRWALDEGAALPVGPLMPGLCPLPLRYTTRGPKSLPTPTRISDKDWEAATNSSHHGPPLGVGGSWNSLSYSRQTLSLGLAPLLVKIPSWLHNDCHSSGQLVTLAKS